MSDETGRKTLDRRRLLQLGGGAALGAGALAPGLLGELARAAGIKRAAAPAAIAPGYTNLHLAATDGWVSLRDLPAGYQGASVDFPDPLAPPGFTTYVFGFRNVTGLSNTDVLAQKGHAQVSAPFLWFDEWTGSNPVKITLTNLGLKVRPDLVDGHTIHWHGFRNANPWFDGVPEMSISVPIGRDFTYYYQPRQPGTYMYHCHFEDVEHVQMGMTGCMFVRPKQNAAPPAGSPFSRFVFNDGDGSTGYDREFAFILTEMWLYSHYQDAHIQQPEWQDYHADAWLLNGRCYPDTLRPNGVYDAHGSPDVATSGLPDRLGYQPNSSLVTCMEGETVLLRLCSLCYEAHTMTTPGLRLSVVGKDAVWLKANGTDNTYQTDVLEIGAGEAFDVLFKAPAYTGGANGKPYDTYLLYDRSYATANNREQRGLGGQRTEIRVYPASAGLPAQTTPNT
jgi:hypothetical protein